MKAIYRAIAGLFMIQIGCALATEAPTERQIRDFVETIRKTIEAEGIVSLIEHSARSSASPHHETAISKYLPRKNEKVPVIGSVTVRLKPLESTTYESEIDWYPAPWMLLQIEIRTIQSSMGLTHPVGLEGRTIKLCDVKQ